MGFLHGIRQIGEYYEESSKGNNPSELEDILNYLKLPLGSQEKLADDRKPREIRIGLKVPDAKAQQLNITGIGEIILSDYLGGGKESDMLWKYLYRDPNGANGAWRYTPIYKLGSGMGENALSELLNPKKTNIDWVDDKDARYFKLNKVLKGFEDTGCFTPDSAALIMQQLVQRAQEIAELWQDKKRSYILVFGIVNEDNRFLFPGEVPAFLAHFRKKKGTPEVQFQNPNIQLPTFSERNGFRCSLCHSESYNQNTLDDMFGFSTFDKVNFIPALNKKNKDSVFPICEHCSSLLSRGKTETESKSSFGIGIKNLHVWVVPEVIGRKHFKQLIEDGEDYLKKGVEVEEDRLEIISKRDASFVYHFLFVEKNQAQLILHRLIEDIPPSQFRKIKGLWQKTQKRFAFNQENDQDKSLDKIISEIVALLLSLSGKTELDKSVMKENVLIVLAALFQNQRIEVGYFKKIAVSRLPGLFNDEDWLIAKKGSYSGARQLNRLWMLFEFLSCVNENLSKEEINV